MAEWIVYYDDDGNEITKGQLIRCKDCKYGHELLDEHGNIDIYRLCKWKERTADWFCADGERRANDDRNG